MTRAISPAPLVAIAILAGSTCACGDFSTGELPSGQTSSGGDYLVLNGGQDYTLDSNLSGLATITVGGRYSASLSETGIDNNIFRMDGPDYSFSFSTSTSNFYVGNNGGDYNTALFSNGASLAVNGINVGSSSTNNVVTFQSGSSLTSSFLEVGQEGGSNNKVFITGPTTRVTLDYLDVGYSTSSASTNNALTISAGAKVTASGTAYDSTIGYYAGSNNNTVVVNGAGSSLSFAYSASGGYCLELGLSSTGNTLTIINGGLVVLGDSSHTGNSISIATGNYVQLGGGLLAIGGDVTGSLSSLLDGNVNIWDGSDYVLASMSDLSYSYCTTVDAVNAFLTANSLDTYSYDASSLVNFTLVTGGTPGVPESSSFAFVGGLGAMGFALLRRRRRAAGN